MVPLIGIAYQGEKESEETNKIIRRYYTRMIEEFKGIPFLTPWVKNSDIRKEMLNMIDGLILTNEFNLDDCLVDDKNTKNATPLKNSWEAELTNYALEKNIPLLANGYGLIFLIKVTHPHYHQAISENTINHDQSGKIPANGHLIYFTSYSKLKTLMKLEVLKVNSFHHLAIKNLPRDFIISAYSEDGIIEAIEHKNNHFCLGMQFRPEVMYENNPKIKLIFSAFINAAKEYQLSKNRKERRTNAN